jgi:hypothetical protein
MSETPVLVGAAAIRITFPWVSGVVFLISPTENAPQLFFQNNGLAIGIPRQEPLPDSGWITMALEDADACFRFEDDEGRW